MAKYSNPADLIAATQKAHDAGYRVMDAYTPFPIEEVSETIGFHRHHNKVPLVTLAGGLFGGIGGGNIVAWAAGGGGWVYILGLPLISLAVVIFVAFA